LTEQAANGTYGSQSLKAIQSEITARLEEINRIAANCEFNGLKMMTGDMTTISLQVG
jgi:flagellin